MTQKQFQKWKRNGNLKLKNQETYDSLLNDLSEDMPIAVNKLRELAKYLSLCLVEENNNLQILKLKLLDIALEHKQ